MGKRLLLSIFIKFIYQKVIQHIDIGAVANQIMELLIIYPCKPLAIDLKLLSFCQEDTTWVDMLTSNLILPFAFKS